MPTIKEQLKANIKFHWDGRKGNLIDQSGNVGNGTFVNSPDWQNSDRGKCLFFDGIASGAKNIIFPADGIGDAITGASAVTIAAWIKPNGVAEINAFIFSQIIGGTDKNGLAFRLDSLTQTNFKIIFGGRSGTGDTFQSHTTTTTYNTHEWHFVIGVFDYANDTITVDVDGVNEGSTGVSFGFNTFVQATASSVDTIGAKESSVGLTGETGGQIRELIIFNTGLTSLQRTQLYEESLQEAFIGNLPKRNFQLPQPDDSVPASLVGAWNTGVRNGNTVFDLSTRGNDGTIVNSVITENGLWGNAGNFIKDDLSFLYMGDVLDDIFAGVDKQFTISAWIKPASIMTNSFMITKYYTGTDERSFIWRISTDSKLEFFASLSLASGNHRAVLGSTPITNLNHWYNIVIEYDGTLDTNLGLDRVRMWVNNVEETNTLSLEAGGLGEIQDGTASFAVGWAAAGDGTPQAGTDSFDGSMDRIRVWTGLQGDTVASEEYAKGKFKLNYRNDFSGEPVTVTALGSGDIGGFHIISGTWKITDDGTDKWNECATAGIAYIERLEAFGTVQFDLYKANASVTYMLFMADVIGGNSATGQDAYYIALSANEAITLGEVTNGTPSSKGVTASGYINAATKYSIRVTRRFDGQFTMYILGGAFTTWTIVDVSGGSGSNPVTDITTTTSKYTVLDFDAGDKISNIKFWEGVVTPDDLA